MSLSDTSLPITEHVPLAPYTTFGIGGAARYFVNVAELRGLQAALLFAHQHSVPFFILGGGSNILVSDRGFPGIVIRMAMSDMVVEGGTISAGAGLPLSDVVEAAAAAGLAGLHYLAGVPGTVGGAIRGNAGAFGAMAGEMVHEVSTLDSVTLDTAIMSASQCRFGYRSSVFKQNRNLIVTGASFRLPPGEPDQLKQEMATIVRRRNDTAEDCRSAGSFFMNPMPTEPALIRMFEEERQVACRNCMIPAGWIIDRAGLRGTRVGGAMISRRHGNYLVNTGTATAEDVFRLAQLVKERVREKMGVELQEEVQFVGF